MLDSNKYERVNILLGIFDQTPFGHKEIQEELEEKITRMSVDENLSLARSYMTEDRVLATRVLRRVIEVEFTFLSLDELLSWLREDNPPILEECFFSEFKRRESELSPGDIRHVLACLRDKKVRLDFLRWVTRGHHFGLCNLLLIRQTILCPISQRGVEVVEEELEVISEVTKLALISSSLDEVKKVISMLRYDDLLVSELPPFFASLINWAHPYVELRLN